MDFKSTRYLREYVLAVWLSFIQPALRTVGSPELQSSLRGNEATCGHQVLRITRPGHVCTVLPAVSWEWRHALCNTPPLSTSIVEFDFTFARLLAGSCQYTSIELCRAGSR